MGDEIEWEEGQRGSHAYRALIRSVASLSRGVRAALDATASRLEALGSASIAVVATLYRE